jgi:hypothetical protein
MRECSQMLEPYVKDDSEAARAQQMVDALSALPAVAVAPGVGAAARKKMRKKAGGLAVKRKSR